MILRRLLHSVVPLVGTWIEMIKEMDAYFERQVVPLVGTWIEISPVSTFFSISTVVPLVGTWIEILVSTSLASSSQRRSPCGNVD